MAPPVKCPVLRKGVIIDPIGFRAGNKSRFSSAFPHFSNVPLICIFRIDRAMYKSIIVLSCVFCLFGIESCNLHDRQISPLGLARPPPRFILAPTKSHSGGVKKYDIWLPCFPRFYVYFVTLFRSVMLKRFITSASVITTRETIAYEEQQYVGQAAWQHPPRRHATVVVTPRALDGMKHGFMPRP